MAIRNLNLVQENNINQNYILESLANLGQRFGIKGDSIVSTAKSVGDILISFLDVSVSSNDYKNYVFSLERDSRQEDTYKFCLYRVDNVNGLVSSGTPQYVHSTYNYWPYSENTLLDEINQHEYSKVQALNNDDVFSFFLFDDTQKEVIIETYKKHNTSNLFSLSSKELVSSVRISDNKLTFINSAYEVNTYTGSVTYQTLKSRENTLNDIFRSLNSKNEDIISYIRQLGFTTASSNSTVSLNQETNTYESSNAELARSLNYSSKNIYSLLFKSYNDDTFTNDENSLYLELLIQLFKAINEEIIYIPLDYELKVSINDNEQWKIYYSTKDISLRYINDSNIYEWFSQNYYLEEDEEKNQYHDSILCFTTQEERILFYQFAIDYDIYLNGVNSILVSQSSTLPYIDNEGYWVINGIQTIKAKGEDAGNPNIIIVESFLDGTAYKQRTSKVISSQDEFSITKAEYKAELLSNRVTWSAKEFKIQPIEKVDLNNTSFTSEFDYLQVYAAIPNLPLDEEIASMLKNAIIINISGLDCINYQGVNYTEEEVKNIYGEDAVITSLWVINDEGTEFDYIRQRNNPVSAADFNYLSNINNLIQYSLASFTPREPDTYLFSHLVFDAISYDLKNNTSDTHSYIYPNLINKLGSQYGTNNLGNYANDMNFIFKFNDNADIDVNDKVLGISQNSGKRYINTNPISSGISNIVTNSLYSYFDIDGKASKYNEYIPNYNVPSLDLSEVLTRNETLLNRLNILSLDSIGTSYLSYIGTSIDTEKNILTIGTSNLNVNLGTETLALDSDKRNFVTQNILNIDFPTINLNGNINISRDLNVDNNINVGGINWKKYEQFSSGSDIPDKVSYSTVFVPTGRYIYETQDLYNNTGSTGIIRLNDTGENSQLEPLISVPLYNWCRTKGKLYTISTIRENYYIQIEGMGRPSRMHNIYISDGIYIPKLLVDLGFENYVTIDRGSNRISLNNVNVKSNMNIITFNSIPVLLLSNSTNLYDYNYYRYDRQYADGATTVDAFVEHIYNFTNMTFTANPLKVTYSISSGNTLSIEIDELTTEDKINYVRKIECNYTKY